MGVMLCRWVGCLLGSQCLARAGGREAVTITGLLGLLVPTTLQLKGLACPSTLLSITLLGDLSRNSSGLEGVVVECQSQKGAGVADQYCH